MSPGMEYLARNSKIIYDLQRGTSTVRLSPRDEHGAVAQDINAHLTLEICKVLFI